MQESTREITRKECEQMKATAPKVFSVMCTTRDQVGGGTTVRLLDYCGRVLNLESLLFNFCYVCHVLDHRWDRRVAVPGDFLGRVRVSLVSTVRCLA